MHITVYSIFMSVLFGNIIALLVYACSKSKFFIRRFGTPGLITAYIFCIIRMALPLEFVFTREVPFRGVMNVIGSTRHKMEPVGKSVSEIMLYIWIGTALLSVIIFICQYILAMRKLMHCPSGDNTRCMEIFEKVLKRTGKRIKVSISFLRNVGVPMGIGIKRRMIILPDRDYSEEELYYTLLHEYTHFINRDLEIKMLVQIFCRIFWWNPAAYIIRRDMERILEIRCDSCVTEMMDIKEKKDYLAVIVSALEGLGKKPVMMRGTSGMISNIHKDDTVERFRIIIGSRKTKNRGKAVAIISLMMCLAVFGLSYSFVFQSDFGPPPLSEIETEPGAIFIHPGNSYIIEDERGEYRIVLPGGGEKIIDKFHVDRMKEQGIEVIKEK